MLIWNYFFNFRNNHSPTKFQLDNRKESWYHIYI